MIASGQLFLSIVGGTTEVSNSLPLIVGNYITGVYNSLPLYIRGSGSTDGAVPLNASMNLYIERWPAAALDLFLQGEGIAVNSGIPLYIYGSQITVSGLDLSMPNVIGISSGVLRLHTIGFG